MVWYLNDSKGNRQIYYKDLSTDIDLKITNVASPKEFPNVGITKQNEPVVVWTDKRNYNDLEPRWDIYAYNIITKEEKKLNTKQGQYVSPSIYGDDIVWHNLTSNEMYHYNLATGLETYIGKGRYPIVAKGKVLYQNANDGGLSLYTIQTMETQKIVELPYHEFVFAFAFNGETALWGKTDFDHIVTYSTANTTSQDITIKNLTAPKKQDIQYRDIILGEHHGAWLEKGNGAAQIIGADLVNLQTYQITNSTSNQKLYSFYGDRLIMKGDQGNIIYRSIVAIPNSGAPVQQIAEKPTLYVEKRVGLEGGLVEIKNLVSVQFPQGALEKESLVTIQERKVQSDKNKLLLSTTWEVSSESAFKKEAALVIHIDPTKIIPQQRKKVAIYFYNKEASAWEYVGGRMDQTAHTITTQIKKPGIYAAMLYDKTFTDIQKHWAQQQIETLASRFIINGIDDQKFGPNQELTRSQFIKMLAIALDLEPVKAETSTFSDVSKSHWGYEWIEAAYQAGIVQGSAGKFNPNQTVSREEMVTMLVRALKLEAKSNSQHTLKDYQDSKMISSWAKSYIAIAIEHGLIEGANGKINPAQASTRAMAAVVIYRLLEKENRL